MSSSKHEPSESSNSNSRPSTSQPSPNPSVPPITIEDEAIQLGLLSIAPDQPAGEVAKKKRKKKERQPGNIQRLDTRNEFESAVFEQGADDVGLRYASGVLYKTAFGMVASELYGVTGGTPGDRDTLPAQCQRKLQLHELIVTNGLRNAVIVGVDQKDTNNQIVQLVRRESNALERYLKSRNIFQDVPLKPRKFLGERDPIPVDPILDAPAVDADPSTSEEPPF